MPAQKHRAVTPIPSRGGQVGRRAAFRFVDIAEQRQLQHVYDNGMQGTNLMVEATGGGAGWLDFDNDGHWDLYINQGGDPAGGRWSAHRSLVPQPGWTKVSAGDREIDRGSMSGGTHKACRWWTSTPTVSPTST